MADAVCEPHGVEAAYGPSRPLRGDGPVRGVLDDEQLRRAAPSV